MKGNKSNSTLKKWLEQLRIENRQLKLKIKLMATIIRRQNAKITSIRSAAENQEL